MKNETKKSIEQKNVMRFLTHSIFLVDCFRTFFQISKPRKFGEKNFFNTLENLRANLPPFCCCRNCKCLSKKGHDLGHFDYSVVGSRNRRNFHSTWSSFTLNNLVLPHFKTCFAKEQLHTECAFKGSSLLF